MVAPERRFHLWKNCKRRREWVSITGREKKKKYIAKKIRTCHGGIDPSDVGKKRNLCEFYRKSRGFDHLVFEDL